MKKIILGIIVVLLASGVFFFMKKSGKNLLSPLSTINPSPTQKSKPKLSNKTSEFVDPAGFKFKYPEGLQIKTITTDDEDSYSALEILSSENDGRITLTASASALTNLDNWNKGKTIKQLKLGDIQAKQIDDGKKMITVALDNGVMFTITADYSTDKNYWQQINSTLVASFTFAAPETSTTNNNDSSGGEDDVVYEGEEIVE